MQCSWIYPLQAKLTDLLTCSPFHVLNLCTQREGTIWKGCTWQDNGKRRIWELVKSHQWLGTPVALLVPSPDDDEQILMHWFLWLLISSFAYFHIGFAFLCTTVNIQVQPQEPKWNTNWIFITLKNICGWHKSFEGAEYLVMTDIKGCRLQLAVRRALCAWYLALLFGCYVLTDAIWLIIFVWWYLSDIKCLVVCQALCA